MTKNSKYAILYSNQASELNFIGILIDDKKHSSEYMKCVQLLADNECEYYIGDDSFTYCTDDFSVVKISDKEEAVLRKLFDLQDDEDEIGIIPNAIGDAYDEGLCEEDESFE